MQFGILYTGYLLSILKIKREVERDRHRERERARQREIEREGDKQIKLGCFRQKQNEKSVNLETSTKKVRPKKQHKKALHK